MSAGRGIPSTLLLDMLREVVASQGLGVRTEHLLDHPHTQPYRAIAERAWHDATDHMDELREEISRLRTSLPLPDERPSAGPALTAVAAGGSAMVLDYGDELHAVAGPRQISVAMAVKAGRGCSWRGWKVTVNAATGTTVDTKREAKALLRRVLETGVLS